MKKTSFTEEQIIALLKRADAGEKITDLCRQAGISDSTFHRWKAKYGGLELSEVKRLKQLEDENRRLKQIVADLTLDNTALKDVLAKKW
jgi:putative transposase